MHRLTGYWLLQLAVLSLFMNNAVAAPIANDSILSQHIKEADGTTGQNTSSGSGIKTDHIQKGAVTDDKISGLISGNKINSAGLNADTVDGFHASHFQSKYSKVAVVAQSGGDYANPMDAINDSQTWCGDPSASNPCLVKVMPGIYTVNWLQMKGFLDVEGSGPNTTVFRGTTDGPIVWFTGPSVRNVELRNLSVENIGAYDCYGVWVNDYAAPSMKDLAIRASCSSRGAGLYVVDHTETVLNNVIISADGPRVNMPVWARSSTLYLNNVVVDGNYGAYPGSVHTTDASTTIITNSRMKGPVSNESVTYISNSMIEGGPVWNYGTIKCIGVYNSTFDVLSSSCQ